MQQIVWICLWMCRMNNINEVLMIVYSRQLCYDSISRYIGGSDNRNVNNEVIFYSKQ